MSALTYAEFVQAKAQFDTFAGFDVDEPAVNPMLLPHQRDIVRWAVAGGRRAVFASFGLGKTFMQLEIMRLTLAAHGSGWGLIVIPLGVRVEFIRDAAKLGVPVRFVRSTDDIDPAAGGIWLTNYESVRAGKIDLDGCTVVSLDEAAVLRSLGSKQTQALMAAISAVPYRFLATATPSPNRYLELVNYADWLGVMDRGQALTRFFQRNSTSAGDLTLHPHKRDEFWLWLSTWSVFLVRPSDLGYPDDGYDLPDLEVAWHEVPVDHTEVTALERDGQARMFRGADLGVGDAHREKRSTIAARVAKAAELVAAASAEEHFILWHHLEAERAEIRRQIPGVTEVYGSLDLDEREARVMAFADGDARILATKPSLSGAGCNLQRHCHRAIYVGIDFDFHLFVQSVHRIHRFQQPHQCRIDVIYAESEREVVRTLRRKWDEHKELTDTMSSLIREHGLSRASIDQALVRSIGVTRSCASGDGWLAVNNDCVDEVTNHVETDSLDLVVTSIPFSNHYEYTPSLNDFGHTDDDEHFFAQMDFLTPQLLRALKPGRIYACHTKDRMLYGNVTGLGAQTSSPFHARTILHTMAHGFLFLGMITVVTDVVSENNQTYRLTQKEMRKDGTKMGVGSPEYILLFRKPQSDLSTEYADEPVTHPDRDAYSLARWQVDAHGFWRSSGDRHLTPGEISALPTEQLYRVFRQQSLDNVYDYESHIQIGEELAGRGALPSTFMLLAPESPSPWVWSDVDRLHNLNANQARRRVEKHICPLPFDIVDRLIERYSNPGELVFDPFGGLSTVAVRAMHLGRKGRTVELNPQYWADGVKYCQMTERQVSAPSLFDLLDEALPVAP